MDATQQMKREAPLGEVALTRLPLRLSRIPDLTDIQVSGAPD
jgi:hypothetical protein